jgi:hypothetical protein
MASNPNTLILNQWVEIPTDFQKYKHVVKDYRWRVIKSNRLMIIDSHIKTLRQNNVNMTLDKMLEYIIQTKHLPPLTEEELERNYMNNELLMMSNRGYAFKPMEFNPDTQIMVAQYTKIDSGDRK